MVRTSSLERDRSAPSPARDFGLARVAHQQVHLGRPVEPRIHHDVLLPVQPQPGRNATWQNSRTECVSPVVTT